MTCKNRRPVPSKLHRMRIGLEPDLLFIGYLFRFVKKYFLLSYMWSGWLSWSPFSFPVYVELFSSTSYDISKVVTSFTFHFCSKPLLLIPTQICIFLTGESLSSKSDAIRLKSGFSFQQKNAGDSGNRTPPLHVIFLDISITLSFTMAHIIFNTAIR